MLEIDEKIIEQSEIIEQFKEILKNLESAANAAERIQLDEITKICYTLSSIIYSLDLNYYLLKKIEVFIKKEIMNELGNNLVTALHNDSTNFNNQKILPS